MIYSTSFNNSSILSFEKDFRFYEPCSINFLLSLERIQTDAQNSHIASERGTFRSNAVWIILVTSLQDIPFGSEFNVQSPHKLFYYVLPQNEFFYFCAYCHTRLVPIPPAVSILAVSELSFKSDWAPVQLSVHFGYELEVRLDDCYLRERVMAHLIKELNVSAKIEPEPDYKSNPFGHISPSMTQFSYSYQDTGRLARFYHDGLDLLYCIFKKKKTHIISFSGWLAPFQAQVWIALSTTLVLLGVITMWVQFL